MSMNLMDNVNMMGDFDDGEGLGEIESFINHRGSGEEPCFFPEETDDESTFDDHDPVIEWSHTDLSAIMDDLELMYGNYSDDEEDMEEEDFRAEDVRSRAGNVARRFLFQKFEEFDENRNYRDHKENQLHYKCDETKDPEWYDYPYGRDFLRDFYVLQDSGMDMREDLLDMLKIADRSSVSESDSEETVFNQVLSDQVEDAINDILIPGMSIQGLKKLEQLIVQEPKLNLRYHLESADPFLLAYIIWGLNFYLSRHATKGQVKTNTEEKEICESSGKALVEESSFSDTIISLGFKLLTWLYNMLQGVRIGAKYEDLFKHLYPIKGCLPTHNEIEFIR